MHKLILVGHLGRTHAEPRDNPTTQKKAAGRVSTSAAKTSEEASQVSPQDRSDQAAADACLSASTAEWEAAFPGQRVLHRDVPNRQRLAMHLAKGMVGAVARGDFGLATAYFDALYNIPRSRSTKKGRA